MKANCPMVVVVTALLSLSAGSVKAQPIKKPQDLDPFNKNGSLNKSARNFDQARLKEMSSNPRPGRDYTKVYIKNETDRAIWVATLHAPYPTPNTSELKSLSAQGDGWSLNSWYKLEPGQRVHVANTSNINFYTYAEDGKGGVWSGSDLQRTVDKRKLGFDNHLILATSVEEHTVRFTK